jgi:hypothetical protein
MKDLPVGFYILPDKRKFLKASLPYDPAPFRLLETINLTDHNIHSSIVDGYTFISANLAASTMGDNKEARIFNPPDSAYPTASRPDWFVHSEPRLLKILDFINSNKNAVLLIQEICPRYYEKIHPSLGDYHIVYPLEDADVNRGRPCIIIHKSLIEGEPCDIKKILGKNDTNYDDETRLMAMSCSVVFKSSNRRVTLVSTHLPYDLNCVEHNITKLFSDIPREDSLIIGGDMNHVYSEIGSHFMNNGVSRLYTRILIPATIQITSTREHREIDFIFYREGVKSDVDLELSIINTRESTVKVKEEDDDFWSSKSVSSGGNFDRDL